MLCALYFSQTADIRISSISFELLLFTICSLSLFLETKRWMVEKVFSFKPDPSAKYYKETYADTRKGRGESLYERQIDSIIIELLEMKRSIRDEKKTV